MQKTVKKEEAIRGLCQLFNLYKEDMKSFKLLLGGDNNILGMIKDDTITITTTNEKITGKIIETLDKIIINYQIIIQDTNSKYNRIEGTISTLISTNNRPEINIVLYDNSNNKVLKLITESNDDYFYMKNYLTREVSCMMKETPRTNTYLKHLTKKKGEKIWDTCMEVSRYKINSNEIRYFYESTTPEINIKGSIQLLDNEYIQFGNTANLINPRLHNFYEEVRNLLELSEVNLFDQTITTSLNYLGNNSLGSIFRINFDKRQEEKYQKVKANQSH